MKVARFLLSRSMLMKLYMELESAENGYELNYGVMHSGIARASIAFTDEAAAEFTALLDKNNIDYELEAVQGADRPAEGGEAQD